MNQEETTQTLLAALEQQYGVDPATARILYVPYRICPLGAHIDHQLGPVTAFALDHGVFLAYGPREDPLIRMRSQEFPHEVQFDLRIPGAPQPGDWGNYLRGAVWALRRGFYSLERGIQGIVTGPWSESGLGSSAAVSVAYLLALEEANHLSLRPEENVALTQAIENRYLGLRNGILDQSAVLFSHRQHLTLIDCATGRYERIPPGSSMPPWAILLAFSGVKRALVRSDYNRRVEECQEAARWLLKRIGRTDDPPLLSRVDAAEFDRFKDKLPSRLRRRAQHYFSEVERVRQGVKAWEAGDLVQFGRLITASGQSSIQNYECGSPPLMDLFEILSRCEGVYGARFSGAGFGGCCLALVDPDKAPQIIHQTQQAYTARHPDLASQAFFAICGSDDAARFVQKPS